MLTDRQTSPPLIAFHLPQFHPIPENDEWWGKGFTEWTNVTRARPLFKGHYQPHLPADMGFYDLRLPETRDAQAELARQYGISGFCYYHYWFNGRRLLERPVNDVISSGRPDFPFCLCWANEPWSRNWDGQDKQLLVDQRYSSEDDLSHIRWLAGVFSDPRYIRVDGKPLFLVYRSRHLPDARRTIECWRTEAQRLGVGELFLARVEAMDSDESPVESGFDAAVEFAPDWKLCVPERNLERSRHLVRRLLFGVSYRLWRTADWFVDRLDDVICSLSSTARARTHHRLIDYEELMRQMLEKQPADYRRFSCVFPMWDNAPRRKKDAVIVINSCPAHYEEWLRQTVDRQVKLGRQGDPIFVNAWNEWAEGCHLEPCQKWGRAYLEATARALRGDSGAGKAK